MPLVNKKGLITLDTNNDWRECKRCDKIQMRYNEYSTWEDK